MKALIQPAPCEYREVVRVAVANNFNCTEAEYRQLGEYVADNPSRYFFVYSNIKTPKLLTLNQHSHKAVITLNPDLTVQEHLVKRLYEIEPGLVAYVRVKYLPDQTPIIELIDELSEQGYPTVITLQRFNGKRTLYKYTTKEHYRFSCSRYRLHGEALRKCLTIADTTPHTYVCDRKGLGCAGCGLCSKLVVGRELPIKSLNLSSSGICKYSCPDCYAKTMQRFLSRIGMPLIRYDKVMRNSKQSGRTQHIKEARQALVATTV